MILLQSSKFVTVVLIRIVGFFWAKYCQYCRYCLVTVVVVVSQVGGGQVGGGMNSNSMVNARPESMEETGGYSGDNDNSTNGLSPNQNQVKPPLPFNSVDKSC